MTLNWIDHVKPVYSVKKLLECRGLNGYDKS
jgi:hypothetical protein